MRMADGEWPEQGFGKLLNSYRIAACLTQEELAERAGLSVRALSDIERNRTTRPYRASVERLADALALSGEARQQFLDASRGRPPAPLLAGAGPALDPFVPRTMPAPVPYFTGRCCPARRTCGSS